MSNTPAELSLKKVVITDLTDAGDGRRLRATWQAVSGASAYNVYISPTPFTMHFMVTVGSSVLLYDFDPPVVSPDIVYYFKIGAVVSSVEQFIEAEPVTLFTNNLFAVNPLSQTTEDNYFQDFGVDGMQWYCEEIRRRHRAILENDGEDFYLYLRKFSGKPCHCASDVQVSSDPDYQGKGRCLQCFGVGIVGGYYPRIAIRIRYGNMPRRHITWGKFGSMAENPFDSWTLWDPKLHEHDFLLRVLTGERFRCTNIYQSEWRGVPLRQEFLAVLIEPSNIIMNVTDSALTAAIATETALNIPSRWDIWM